MRNERGITLIETLATMAILSIIGVIIWSAFFHGYHYSNKAITKNRIEQEANVVITNLTRIHQTSSKYKIHSANGVIVVTATNPDKTIEFQDSQLNYFIRLKKSEESENDGTIGPIYPQENAEHTIVLILTIEDRNDPNNFVEIETILYRL